MTEANDFKQRNLRELERRRDMHGPGQAPLFLLNQIAELRRQLGLPPEEAQPGLEAASKPDEIITMPPAASFKLQLQQTPPQARVLDSPQGGESEPVPFDLPFDETDLALVLKALTCNFGPLPANKFSADEVVRLRTLGLVAGDYLLHTMGRTVGQRLYQSLFTGALEKLFFAATQQSKRNRAALPLQLLFDAAGSLLASYPWELLDDGIPLVANGVVDLTRYITFSDPPRPLVIPPPLHILIVSPRPANLPALPHDLEPQAVAQPLSALAADGLVRLSRLPRPTRQDLLHFLSENSVQVVHFDGHGSYGRLCPVCQILYTPVSKQCQKCGYLLNTTVAQGYLAFENEAGQANYVAAGVMANSLSRSQVQLAVLSACRSGQVDGGVVFSGVGPALIRAGIPAVLAMQAVIPDDQAIDFLKPFYRALARFEPLVAAVGRGRQALYDDTFNPQTWFIPVLYLRSKDTQGYLFQSQAD